ncbi:YbaK/EbsC family protein [Polaromonas naphthalenivorans]|uniref:YbaK/prolyl-tRNA synthetase associated region n=1 Tax=Polaromonas naphthalenivorans (strain CJ2) TaxID=365044 RepID=A1VJH2_POLNA|nr:YbaK/EbsC family protein [Polaromonas naphthalenivorans]ABM35800.1 YbaK/prolyl-tRNA synthetase associated region [Polaromonas naphthalenivorans CJ2]
MCGAELKVLPEGVQRVAAFLQDKGHMHAPVMLDDAARTAQQAADALGVAVGQIAKSIIFRRKSDDAAVLVVTSGDRRVDEKKVEALVCLDGKRLGRADAAFVKSRTGFSIGGVSPLAHATPSVTLIDQSLFRFEQIWAAAGHPHGVFQLSPWELQDLTGAPVADLAVDEDDKKRELQRAISLVRLRAPTPDTTLDVSSPCISICRMNASSGLCEGCFRTRDEIAGWSGATDEGKRAVWKIIEQRMAALQT